MMVPVLGGPEEGLVSWIDEADLPEVALLARPNKPLGPVEKLAKQIEARLRGVRAKRAASSLSAAVGWLLPLG